MGRRRGRARELRIHVGAVGLLLVAIAVAVQAGAQQGSNFFTLTPCRVYDTRWGAGPLAGGFDRWIPVGGFCGIPPDASAGSFNFTSINPSGYGLLTAYPCCSPRSNVVVSLKAGSSPAGLGVIGLGSSGQIGVYLDAPFSTTAGLAVDVSGYFRLPAPIQQWQEWEQILLSPADYTANDGDPYSEVEVDVRFTNPATGVTFLQPAYWDGQDGDPRIFRVAMAFPAGSWSWQIDRCDRNGAACLAGWTPSQGTIQVQSNTSTGNPLYDRGFVQQVETVVGGQTVALSPPQFPDGTAFTWIGDTAWTAPPREYDPPGTQAAQTAAWSSYLADRKARGFTAIQIAPAMTWQPRPGDSWRALPDAKNFSFNKKAGCSDALASTTPIPNVLCWTANNKYWTHFASMVGKGTEAGFLIAVVGVMNPVGIAPGNAYPDSLSAKKFARELRGRLNKFAVILSPAFDDDPDEPVSAPEQTRRVLMNQVGIDLISVTPTGARRPLTNHLSSGKANCDEYQFFAMNSARWMTHYLFQSGHGGAGDLSGACAPSGTNDVQDAMERARVMPLTLTGYSPKLPAVNAEGPYDRTDYATLHPNVDTRYRIRQAGYLSALSNAAGYTYGAVGLSLWDKPGGNFANEPSSYFVLLSATDMTHLKSNLLGRHLVSHPEWILNNSTQQKYKMVLATDEVSFVLAYLPGDESGPVDSSNGIAIDASHLSCLICPSQSGTPWSMKWLDPRSNTTGTGSCSGPPGGSLTFTRPVCPPNSNCDWLLKLEKTGTCPQAASAAASDSKVGSAGAVSLEVWNDTSAGDGTSAIYAAQWGATENEESILLSPAGRAFQMAPRVGGLGGNLLVAWQADGMDGSLYGIYGALLGSHGEVSGPFKINHYTEHDQREPAVAGGARGNALVVWSSYGQDGDQGGIFGRLLEAGGPQGGSLLGKEFEIAEVRSGHQQHPQVLADSEGFWVAWESIDSNGLSSVVSVRRLGVDGRPESPEVRLPAPTGEQRRLRTLDRPTPDSIVVSWWGQDSRGADAQLWQQRIGPQGPLGPVNTGGDE